MLGSKDRTIAKLAVKVSDLSDELKQVSDRLHDCDFDLGLTQGWLNDSNQKIAEATQWMHTNIGVECSCDSMSGCEFCAVNGHHLTKALGITHE
jgi:hypothetical protein